LVAPDLTLDRIVLGTVQIGLPYGKRRGSGLMSEDAAEEILDAAWDLGIRNFDTAEAYGVSAARLSHWLGKSDRLQFAHVITKIAATLPTERISLAASDAIARFRGARKITLLSHGPISARNWSAMHATAFMEHAFAGQSVYERQEVVDAWSVDGVSVVQAPANVFDSRAMIAHSDDSREMHYRSVFLQGLLLDAPSVADARVPGSGRLAEAVGQAADAIGTPAAALLAAAVLRACRPVDKIILGADKPEDLMPIPAALTAPERSIDEFLDHIARVPAPAETVLDPRTWDPKR